MNTDRFKFRVFYGGDYSITPYCTIDMNGKVWLDTSIMRGDGLGDFDTDIIDITDKCTVEQCTGLKDKNGDLIYEGDRVGFYVYGQDEEWHGQHGTVIWYLSSWGAETSSRFVSFESAFPMCNPQNIEIIGNVHEQAE